MRMEIKYLLINTRQLKLMVKEVLRKAEDKNHANPPVEKENKRSSGPIINETIRTGFQYSGINISSYKQKGVEINPERNIHCLWRGKKIYPTMKMRAMRRLDPR